MTFLPSFFYSTNWRKGKEELKDLLQWLAFMINRNVMPQCNLTFLVELLSLLTQPRQKLTEIWRKSLSAQAFATSVGSWADPSSSSKWAWLSFRDRNFLLDCPSSPSCWKISCWASVWPIARDGASSAHRPCIFQGMQDLLAISTRLQGCLAFSSCSFLKNGQLWFLPPNPRPKAWSGQLHDNNPKHSQHSSFEAHLRASLIQVPVWRTQSRLCSPKNGKRVKYLDLGLAAVARGGWKLGREGSHPAS